MNFRVYLAFALVVVSLAGWIYFIWLAFGLWPAMGFVLVICVWSFAVACRAINTRAKKRAALVAELKRAASEGRREDFSETMLSIIQLDSNLPRERLDAEMNKHSREIKAASEKILGTPEEMLAREKLPTAQKIESQIAKLRVKHK